jgi:small nuclear ribonucleoprotein (snRNP)-like protein
LAVVGSGGVWVRVDEEALALPGRYLRSGVQTGKYREIVGVKSDPPPDGQIWTEEDLLAGVNILRLIDGKPFTGEITAIDVSNYRGRLNTYKPHIVLTTENQSEIRWGRAIGTEGRIEVNHEMKLHHLEELFIRYGSLNKLAHADLRGQKVLVSLRDGK